MFLSFGLDYFKFCLYKFTLGSYMVRKKVPWMHPGPVCIVKKIGTFHGAFHKTFFTELFTKLGMYSQKSSELFTVLSPNFFSRNFSSTICIVKSTELFTVLFTELFTKLRQTCNVSRSFRETTCGLFAITLYQMDRF